MSGKIFAIVAVVVIIVAAAAGFGGYTFGVKQGQTQAQSARDQFLASRGLNGAGAQGAAGGQGGNRQFNADNFANGQVKSINGDTIELSTANAVVTVKLTGQTQITKMATGSTGDITPNERITVEGTRGADGTLTAQNIQIGGNRAFGGFPGPNGTPGAPPNAQQPAGATQ